MGRTSGHGRHMDGNEKWTGRQVDGEDKWIWKTYGRG